jgi:hypothetical protein
MHMSFRFDKHYTRAEAKAMLPQIRGWLSRLQGQTKSMVQYEERVEDLMKDGDDVGGPTVNQWITTRVDMQMLVEEFEKRDIQLKDLERGLLDFPAVIGGKEVFLCWEQDEEDIEFWHDLDSGYAGREKL